MDCVLAEVEKIMESAVSCVMKAGRQKALRR